MSIFGRKKSPMRRPLGGAGTTTVGDGPAVTRVPVEAVPQTSAPTTIPRIEDVGEPTVARLVDPAASDFKLLGPAKLYKPGDEAKFYVRAVSVVKADGTREPVPNIPVRVFNKAQNRQLGTTVKTNTLGVAIIPYTVQKEDMIGDPNTPEADTGSYICIAYVSGRVLRKLVVLWDTY